MAELTVPRFRFGDTSGIGAKLTAAAHAAQRTARTSLAVGRRSAVAGARAAGTGGRVAWTAVKLALRVPPPTPRTRTPRTPRTPEVAAAALAGAGVEFLLDPAEGKRRRKLLLDRARSTGRRLGQRAANRARYAERRAAGAVHEATSTATAPADDRTLADRIRTEIFRRPDAPKGAVNVSAVNGIVYLRGEVGDRAEIERLVQDAQRVPGVRAVENLMHTPGTPAPMGGAG